MSPTRSKFFFISAALTAAALSACTTLNVTSDVNARANIASCHTYAWAGEVRASGPTGRAEANPVNAERLREAIATSLQARGVLPAANRTSADCLVGFAVGVRQVIDGPAGPYSYWGWGWGWGGRRGFGAWGWDEPYVWQEGLIAIDLYDAHNHQPIWHATVNQDITHLTGADAETRISAAVTALFSKYPGATAGAAAGAPAARDSSPGAATPVPGAGTPGPGAPGGPSAAT